MDWARALLRRLGLAPEMGPPRRLSAQEWAEVDRHLEAVQDRLRHLDAEGWLDYARGVRDTDAGGRRAAD